MNARFGARALAHGLKAGTTAATLCLVGSVLLVADCGDSEVVLCRAGRPLVLSRRHCPNVPFEQVGQACALQFLIFFFGCVQRRLADAGTVIRQVNANCTAARRFLILCR